MITGIKRIKGLGVFADYVPANDLPSFCRFNVVFGENGSGKTTLSRLFYALEHGQHPDYPDLDFTLHTESGAIAKGQKHSSKLRVFNADYVEANIGQFHDPLRPILIVGEANKTLAKELDAEIALRDQRQATITVLSKASEKLSTERGKLFSDIAKTIGEASSGKTMRTYRKPDAEAAYAKITNHATLEQEALDLHRSVVRQEQLERVDVPAVSVSDEDGHEASDLDTLTKKLVADAQRLCLATAQGIVISRLAAEADIASWVEDGLRLHENHKSERCEFCQQPLPESRLAELAKHFGESDQQLKMEIEELRVGVSRVCAEIGRQLWPSKLALYPELRNDYEVSLKTVEIEKANLLLGLQGLNRELEKKLGLRTSPYSLDVEIDTSKYQAACEVITGYLTRHNEKTEAFETERETSRSAIELHYLASIAGRVGEIDTQIADHESQISDLRNGSATSDPRSLAALQISIDEKKQAVSDAHNAGTELTKHLVTFLGRSELSFESSDDGYKVLRQGKPARKLSEGEKTAIAFIYFIVQLQEREFNLPDGVIVIDDPISSLDAAAIYQAFALLKNTVKHAKQVFILTHNFDFLKLVIDWLKYSGTKKSDQQYYMVICEESAAGRNARLTELDKLLKEHPTEYHFLFKVLYTFKSDGTLLSSYHIPNVARKVLETFLDFQMPAASKLYSKLEAIKFDENKKTAIYKFTNDLSHRTGKGFDPALVAECQKNVTHLLEMIKTIAPDHYAGLEKLSV